MNNYEVGMLCIITGTNFEETSSNIGKCVELIEYLPLGTEVSKVLSCPVVNKEDCWVVKGIDLVQRKITGIVLEHLKYAGAAQRHLMPLKGDEIVSKQKEEEFT